MSTATTLTVLIKGSNQLSGPAAAANKSIGTLGAAGSKTSAIIGKLGQSGALLTGGLVTGAVIATKALFDMGAESERVNAQTTAGIKSTGGAANVTLAQVNSLSTGIQNYSGIGDESVQTGANMILTFRNITNEVGKGNDIFNQATVAAADMATKMAGGATPSAEEMQGAALRLGKALNDPIAGMTALSRAGVQFTAAQKTQIAALVASGDTMGAQKVILAELTTEFGGSARALGSTFQGTFNIVKESVGNALETIVVGLMKVATPLFMVVGGVLKLAQAGGVLVPGILAAAAAWAIYSLAAAGALGVTSATLAVIDIGLGPLIAIGVALAVVLVGAFKLVQGAMTALSGGWSKLSVGMKVAVVALWPIWLPIVAAIKLVVATFNFLKTAVTSVASAVSNWVKNWLAGLGPVGDAIQKLLDGVGMIGDISAANTQAATQDMLAFGHGTVLAAQQGGSAITGMGKQIALIRQTLQASNPDQWSQMFQAGLTTVDNALKSGTLSAADAQKAYLAWGLSSQAAAKRAAASMPPVAQSATAMAKASVSAADVSAAGWESLSHKTQTSMAAIAKAQVKALMAAQKMAVNTSKVTTRLTNDYGLTADQADKFLAGATPQSMAAMAKAGGKSFGKVGVAAQKVNGIMPSVAKGTDAVGKSAAASGKNVEKMASGVDKGTKSAQAGAKTTEALSKGQDAVGKSGSQGAAGASKLGSSVQSAGGKANSAASQIARLHTEISNLPANTTIQVTVNVNKTGQALGGIVPGLARGGVSSGVLTEVGEWGREFAQLPPGTRVFNHAETMGMDAAMKAGGRGSGGQIQAKVSGKLRLDGGDAWLEDGVLTILEDGNVIDDALTRKMGRPF